MKILDIPRSGSYAGIVSSHNRAGQYVRNRRSPVQPIGTGRRAAVRAAFTSAAVFFGGLTATQQDAWTTFANTHPVTDSLGQTIVLTGQQMAIRVNASRQNAGIGNQVPPPVDLTMPDISAATVAFATLTGFVLDNFTGVSGQFINIAFSQPLSTSRRFWKTFWQPMGTSGVADASTPPFHISTAIYSAQFGTVAAGQKIFVRLTPISVDGWNATPVIMSLIVT